MHGKVDTTSCGGGLAEPGARAMWVDDRGAVNLSVATANEGPATFLIDVAPDSAKIRGIRVMVGG